jgi:hypothetical protein
VTSLCEVIDLHTQRDVARQNHVPEILTMSRVDAMGGVVAAESARISLTVAAHDSILRLTIATLALAGVNVTEHQCSPGFWPRGHLRDKCHQPPTSG